MTVLRPDLKVSSWHMRAISGAQQFGARIQRRSGASVFGEAIGRAVAAVSTDGQLRSFCADNRLGEDAEARDSTEGAATKVACG